MKKLIRLWQKNNIAAGITTKQLGPFTKFKDPKALRTDLNLNKKDIVSAEQIHQNLVAIVNKNDAAKTIKKVDGLVTKTKGLYLLIYSADCIPLFFYEQYNQIIALSHAGKVGSLHKISVTTIKQMQKLGAKIQYIKVHLGPHICSKCYPVNLAKINIRQLTKIGIKETNITTSPYCTYEDKELFYSYRRDKPLSKNIDETVSFIALL